MESGIFDDTTLYQCGALNVGHADLMDDLTWQLDIALPPCADVVQILLKHEEDVIIHQSGIHTLRSESLKSTGVTDLCEIFESDPRVVGFLTHGRRYKCAHRR